MEQTSLQQPPPKPARKSYWVQIVITIVAGFFIGFSSCFGLLTQINHPTSPLQTFYLWGLYVGGTTFLIGCVWLLVQIIQSLRGK